MFITRKANVRKYAADIDKYPRAVQVAVSTVFKYWLDRMQAYARNNHRFKKRTGNLMASIGSRMRFLTGEVYINEFWAPYGEFVHRGHGSWAPDPFIYNAFDQLEDNMKWSLLRVLKLSYLEYEEIKKSKVKK